MDACSKGGEYQGKQLSLPAPHAPAIILHWDYPMKIAILDDYLRLSQTAADWSMLRTTCDITVFDRPLSVHRGYLAQPHQDSGGDEPRS